MSDRKQLSRRRLLAAIGAVAGGVTIGDTIVAVPAHARANPGEWSRHTTQNGWTVIDGTKIDSRKIEGSNASVALRAGYVAAVLLHVARRFHYEIDALKPGDVHGHLTDHSVMAPFESNYLSGTALAIRPGLYPAGSAGNLFPQQLVVIRDILAECEGVVRWGGDDNACPKEGHFQIDVPPGNARLKSVAAKIQAWDGKPGLGAGSPVDPLLKTRRAAAQALERTQRAP